LGTLLITTLCKRWASWLLITFGTFEDAWVPADSVFTHVPAGFHVELPHASTLEWFTVVVDCAGTCDRILLIPSLSP